MSNIFKSVFFLVLILSVHHSHASPPEAPFPPDEPFSHHATSSPVGGTDAPVTKLVFITNEAGGYDGDFAPPGSDQGVFNADAKCQGIANRAGRRGEFKAWLSDSIGHSPEQDFEQADVPYILADGRVIANDWTDLTHANEQGEYLRAPINVDIHGNEIQLPVQFESAWTGTNPDGTPIPDESCPSTNFNCNDWTSDDPASLGALGNSSGTSSRWTDYYIRSCVGGQLYCFEQ